MGGISFCTQFQFPERQSIAHFFRFCVGVLFLVNHALRRGRRKHKTQGSAENAKEKRSLIETRSALSNTTDNKELNFE
jgi:hypothetical protein